MTSPQRAARIETDSDGVTFIHVNWPSRLPASAAAPDAQRRGESYQSYLERLFDQLEETRP